MIVRDNPTDAWKSLSDNPAACDELIDVNGIAGPSIAGMKRPLSPSTIDIPGAKRARGITMLSALTGPCLAPPPNVIAGKIFTNYNGPSASANGTGDIFFSEGFRTRWCRCSSVSILAAFLHVWARMINALLLSVFRRFRMTDTYWRKKRRMSRPKTLI